VIGCDLSATLRARPDGAASHHIRSLQVYPTTAPITISDSEQETSELNRAFVGTDVESARGSEVRISTAT